ncbi:MAG: thioesterase family protein [Solirubrobacteraceae bacterium]
MSDAVYEERSGSLLATGLARGPWDHGAQHGGAPAAILMRELERAAGEDGLALSRVTFEFLAPVPLGELQVHTELLRPGRRVQLLESLMLNPEGTVVVRARALRVARADVDAGPVSSPPPGPEHARSNGFGSAGAKIFPDGVEMFPGGAIEVRFVTGRFDELGPAIAWFRFRVPLVAGEQPSALQRLAAASDFPNGIGTPLPWDEYVFINPDLTLYIERAPVGEWICLDASMRVHAGGVGLSEATLYDTQGRVGRCLQSLYVARRAARRALT